MEQSRSRFLCPSSKLYVSFDEKFASLVIPVSRKNYFFGGPLQIVILLM